MVLMPPLSLPATLLTLGLRLNRFIIIPIYTSSPEDSHIFITVLLAIIREDIQNRLESMSIDEGRIMREIQRRFNGDSLDDAKKRRDDLAARLDELASLGRKLYEDRLKGIISTDTFKALSEKAEDDKAAVRFAYNEFSELISSEERRVIESDSIIPNLREFLSLETLTHEMLSSLIERVIVSESEGRSTHRTHDVRIIYRFEALV